MKKLFFAVCTFVCAMLMVACTDGPTLVGKWKSDTKSQKDEEANVTMDMELNLAEDKTMTIDVAAVMDSESKEVSMHMPFTMGYKGKWDASDKKMFWTPTDSSQYVKFEQDSIKMTFKDPAMEALGEKLLKSFKEEFNKEMGPNLLKSIAKTDSMDYTLEGDVLKIISDKDTIVFRRQK